MGKLALVLFVLGLMILFIFDDASFLSSVLKNLTLHWSSASLDGILRPLYGQKLLSFLKYVRNHSIAGACVFSSHRCVRASLKMEACSYFGCSNLSHRHQFNIKCSRPRTHRCQLSSFFSLKQTTR